MIKITKDAADKFNEIIQESKNPENAKLRVSFGGYGWGGPKLNLTLDELKKGEDDTIVESEGVKIIYTSNLETYLNGRVIDYSNSWFRRGFFISGSNSSC